MTLNRDELQRLRDNCINDASGQNDPFINIRLGALASELDALDAVLARTGATALWKGGTNTVGPRGSLDELRKFRADIERAFQTVDREKFGDAVGNLLYPDSGESEQAIAEQVRQISLEGSCSQEGPKTGTKGSA